MTSQSITQAFQERISEGELLNCMRCGFCLPACPTYVETQDEVHSPRGRISLMMAVRNGEIEEVEEVEDSLNVCLGCRACEPACPAGVNYGQMLEEARAIFQEHKKVPLKEKAMRKTTLNTLFQDQSKMEKATSLLGFYQRSGLQKTSRKLKVMNFFPEHMRQMEQVLPKITKRKDRQDTAHFPSETETKATVAMFRGCLMDTMFYETNQSTIELLNKAGCDVVVPDTQSCCGALHGHSGEKNGSINLAKQNIQAFEQVEADYIITNAGGCGAFLHDYDHLLKDDDEWSERAEQFSNKIVDFSSILVDLNFVEGAKLKVDRQIVTYQDSCHLRNVMGVSEAPRKLIQAIENVEYKEMPQADQCCGSAGIYNLTQPDMSMQILDHKMEKVETTQATTIVTTNPGCLLQMKLGIERQNQSEHVRAVHLADLLLEACY
ncbi:(Fe-S)-binding protein [Alkalibacillus haloalkaliphilus]|uniref:(Fe-S)-binding protein n=1 Tax=Alkalibacillus haloalkaliphilus TaxID=94136 RepID=UPI002935E1E0|nr:(Fe-S)-binding protein [Alkalibacillus haloalkaliphilus]MDV2582254.1 (Fe-S)-binding protein [Alkalibacillus haloalkaliphilus]